jgi:hypothetical protein
MGVFMTEALVVLVILALMFSLRVGNVTIVNHLIQCLFDFIKGGRCDNR